MSYTKKNKAITKNLYLSKNFSNNEKETKSKKNFASEIPQHEIDALARAFLPTILEFYRSEEGQREFAEWKANRDKQKGIAV